VVRIHALWNLTAPGRTATRPPAGFDASDHTDPGYDWRSLDPAIDLVHAAGMRVMLTVTGPGPLWTSSRPGLGNPRWEPSARHFADFARAVATRYGDRVDRYLLWNEPNLRPWLEPQWRCRRVGRRAATPRGTVRPFRTHACEPYGATVYRRLVRAAGPAIEDADPGAEVVIGELAPIARGRAGISRQVAPLLWLRGLGCVDDKYRPLRTGMCRGFRPASGDALGYHPHPVLRAPDERNPNRDEAQMADLSRLARVLDRLTSARRIRTPGGRRLDLHLTEFGYQTAPPDNGVGIPLPTHARWLQQAAYEAWRHPRVLGLTHYQWDDEPAVWRTPAGAYHGWQSGLRLVDGEPKPALLAFPNPFALDLRRGGRAQAWGQVRPGGAHTVTLLRRRGVGSFEPVGTYVTSASGYWSETVAVRRGDELRYAWVDALGAEHLSGIAAVPRRGPPRVVAASAP
jgi:hypothetical protein